MNRIHIRNYKRKRHLEKYLKPQRHTTNTIQITLQSNLFDKTYARIPRLSQPKKNLSNTQMVFLINMFGFRSR